MARIGQEDVAPQAPARRPLVEGNAEVDRERAEHHGECDRIDTRWRTAFQQPSYRDASDTVRRDCKHRTDSRGGVRLVLAVPVRMIAVSGTSRETQAEEADDI
jgi:hypothetical protein